jgi:hypothetical protein
LELAQELAKTLAGLALERVGNRRPAARVNCPE